MEWLSHYGGTATAGPNFSYVLAARALRTAAGLDLSPLRVALNGAEPVDPDAVERFVEPACRHGMRPGAVFPAFGMAEVVIGGTFPEPMARAAHRRRRPPGARDRALRRSGRRRRTPAPAAWRCSAGRCPGLEIRIVDPRPATCQHDREVGELEIRGTSVTPGYYKRPDATAAAFHDGWLRTGDLAYLLDGELVVCGRIKDVIIVGGRNVFPDGESR